MSEYMHHVHTLVSYPKPMSFEALCNQCNVEFVVPDDKETKQNRKTDYMYLCLSILRYVMSIIRKNIGFLILSEVPSISFLQEIAFAFKNTYSC